MPKKTIYVKDTDLPLFERAHALLGQSLSSLFGEFLKERVEKLTPDEHRVRELIAQISDKLEDVKNDPRLGSVKAEYAEAQQRAEETLRNLRERELRKAEASFLAANMHYTWAERELEDLRVLDERIGEILNSVV